MTQDSVTSMRRLLLTTVVSVGLVACATTFVVLTQMQSLTDEELVAAINTTYIEERLCRSGDTT